MCSLPTASRLPTPLGLRFLRRPSTGPGDVSGTRQSGVLDLKVADIVKDEGLMAQVRTLAQNVLADDPHLTKPQNLPIRNYFMTKHKVSDFSMIS